MTKLECRRGVDVYLTDIWHCRRVASRGARRRVWTAVTKTLQQVLTGSTALALSGAMIYVYANPTQPRNNAHPH